LSRKIKRLHLNTKAKGSRNERGEATISKDHLAIPTKIQERVKELRRNSTHAETRLLLPLQILAKAHNLTLVFQCPLPYSRGWAIIDYVLNKKLGIEVDGIHHQTDPIQQARDKDRDSRLEWEYDLKIIRIPNPKVLEDPLGVSTSLVDLILKERGEEMKMSRLELEMIVQQQIFERLGIGFIT
jgi:very-short-patch-repair endonuclease